MINIPAIKIDTPKISGEPANYIAAGSRLAYDYIKSQLAEPHGPKEKSMIYLDGLQFPVCISAHLPKNIVAFCAGDKTQVFEIGLEFLEKFTASQKEKGIEYND